MAVFIREGHFSRHIRRMRPIYARRRRVLVEAIARELGDRATIPGDEAGMHLTVFLKTCRNDAALAAKAAERSLWVSALSASYVGSEPRQGLVLGFGNADETAIPQAVRQLKDLTRRRS